MAEKYGINVEYDGKENIHSKDILSLHDEIQKISRKLFYTSAGEEARKYILDRSFNDDDFNEFGIGFLASDVNYSAVYKMFPKDILYNSGFFKESKYGATYARFFNRLMLPIKNITGSIAAFAGRKLAKKRNLLKQYNEGYKTEDFELTLERFDDAKYILDIWERDINMAANHGSDYYETLEALEKITEFNLRGMISYADNKPSGFVLGEELNDETFALHFAKGIREYKGIYQHLYNSFSIKLNSKYKYINFEQDLGKDTLRQAKSTYYPDEMRKKYRVALIK